MNKPVLVLKPNIINALLPLFARNYAISLLLTWTLYAAYLVFRLADIVRFTLSVNLAMLFFFAAVITLIPLTVKIFILANTTYYFYDSYIVNEFRFFSIKKSSAPYNLIINITTNVSLWDRICKSGEIVIHTSESLQKGKGASIMLSFVKNPEKVEKLIYHLIKLNKGAKQAK